MKSMIFAFVLALGSYASAATTICGAFESRDGENFDHLVAQKQIAQDGQPVVILEREQDIYVAIDTGSMMAIGQVVAGPNGESQVSVMAASNGTQVQLLATAANLSLFCARQ